MEPQAQSSTNGTDLLPADVLRLIFSYVAIHPRLFVVSTVSKRWRKLVLASVTTIRRLAHPRVTSLLPSLTELETDCPLNMQFPTALRSLRLTSVATIPPVISGLTSLTLPVLTGRTFPLLMHNASTLVELSLAAYTQPLMDTSFAKFLPALRLPMLRSLSYYADDRSEFSSFLYSLFLPHLSQLESLSCTNRYLLNNLLKLQEPLVNLRHLAASVAALTELAPHLPSLRSVEVRVAADEPVPDALANLEMRLYLSCGEWQNPKWIKSLPRLHYLNASFSMSIGDLLFSLTSLTTLSLFLRKQNSRDCLLFQLPKLRMLELDFEDVVPFEVLTYVVDNCRALVDVTAKVNAISDTFAREMKAFLQHAQATSRLERVEIVARSDARARTLREAALVASLFPWLSAVFWVQ